jgi:hypothetical protein
MAIQMQSKSRKYGNCIDHPLLDEATFYELIDRAKGRNSTNLYLTWILIRPNGLSETGNLNSSETMQYNQSKVPSEKESWAESNRGDKDQKGLHGTTRQTSSKV